MLLIVGKKLVMKCGSGRSWFDDGLKDGGRGTSTYNCHFSVEHGASKAVSDSKATMCLLNLRFRSPCEGFMRFEILASGQP